MNSCKPSPKEDRELLIEKVDAIGKEYAKCHKALRALSDLYVDAKMECRALSKELEARDKQLNIAMRNAAKLELIVSDNKIRMSKEMKKEVLDLLRF